MYRPLCISWNTWCIEIGKVVSVVWISNRGKLRWCVYKVGIDWNGLQVMERFACRSEWLVDSPCLRWCLLWCLVRCVAGLVSSSWLLILKLGDAWVPWFEAWAEVCMIHLMAAIMKKAACKHLQAAYKVGMKPYIKLRSVLLLLPSLRFPRNLLSS